MSPPPAGTGRSLDWGGALTRVGEGAEDDVARVVDGHGDAVAEDLAHLREGVEGAEPRVGRLVVTRSGLARDPAATEGVVEVLPEVAVDVRHDAARRDSDEPLDLGDDARLLLDLSDGGDVRVLARVDDAGDRRPRAVVRALDEQH